MPKQLIHISMYKQLISCIRSALNSQPAALNLSAAPILLQQSSVHLAWLYVALVSS